MTRPSNNPDRQRLAVESAESPDEREPPIDSRRFWILLVLLAPLCVVALLFSPVLRETDLQRAEEAMANGSMSVAIATLDQHIAAHPEDDTARLKLAGLLRGEDPDLALEHLQRISVDGPEFLAAVRQIAVISLQTKRDSEAKSALLMLEHHLPNDFGVQLSLAELLFHTDENQEALPHAVRAANLEPNRTQTYLLIAEIRDELNQGPDMIAPLLKATELSPRSYEAHAMLAYAYNAAGRTDDARREALWCLERKSNDHFPHRILASVARDEGNFEQAREELERALALAPGDVDSRILKADLLMYEREYQAAYDCLSPLLNEHSDYTPLLGALARAAIATGRIDEAKSLNESIAEHYELNR